jgi:hypothetical protein
MCNYVLDIIKVVKTINMFLSFTYLDLNHARTHIDSYIYTVTSAWYGLCGRCDTPNQVCQHKIQRPLVNVSDIKSR